MLTEKGNYKIPGTQIQGLIVRQMNVAAYYLKESRKDDSIREVYEEYSYTEEYAIWILLELQGIFLEPGERSMVVDYIHDMIKHMSNE